MKEFRIALVCYGGVSLAIYMHGVVREIHKLVRASAAYDQFRQGHIHSNPFDPERDTEYAYWEVLDKLERYESIKVVIDVISGASAGGINGVYLGKALAQNRSQDHLRDMWLHNAAIRQLMQTRHAEVPRVVRWLEPVLSRVTGLRKMIPELQQAYGPMMAFTYRAILNRQVAPPFDGDRMLEWLYDGVIQMDRDSAPSFADVSSLVPHDLPLELYITTTDFYGYPSYVPVHDPSKRGVHDQKYRHVLRFQHLARGDAKSDFKRNAELAFAARATSSLPGGFSPVQIGDLKRVLASRMADAPGPEYNEQRFLHDFFRHYELAGSDPMKTCFADGGILDNRPFSHAIRAILKKSATTQVVRRLIYIDPHPVSEAAPADARLPGTFETLLASLSRIPKHEPIHDEIWNLNAFNRRIRRINDTIESTRPVIESLVAQVGREQKLELEADPHTLEEWRRAVNEHAADLEAAGYISYVSFKLRSLVEELGNMICDEVDYPEGTGHAHHLKAILRRWMERRRILPVGDAISDDQEQFLKLFDLGFRWRRIRFLIRDVNALYTDVHRRMGPPQVADLDAMKRDLYDLMEAYRTSLAGGEHRETITSHLHAAFGEDILTPRIRHGRIDPDDFLDEHGDKVDVYFALLRDKSWDNKKTLHFRLSSIIAQCANWEEGPRRQFLTRFVGFPFWDVMIFPLIDMAEVGELYEIKGVRMSPDDAVLLGAQGSEKKLRGVRYQHFGAFFSRRARENDYLWGRLDSAERLIDILVDAAMENTERKLGLDDFLTEKTIALGAILNEEEDALEHMGPKIRALREVLSQCKVPRQPAYREKRAENQGAES